MYSNSIVIVVIDSMNVVTVDVVVDAVIVIDLIAAKMIDAIQ